MAWLDLRAELAEEFEECAAYELRGFEASAAAVVARRYAMHNERAANRRPPKDKRPSRNARAAKSRANDRALRVRDAIPQLPRPVACECGERFATQGGLIGHVRFCRLGRAA